MTEQFANNASSTLNGTITNVQTTLVVNSATLFPSVPQFRIIIDSEIMLVTGVSGTTFTVSRGVENTAQTTHTNGAAVNMILTAGAMQQFQSDTINTIASNSYSIVTFASRPTGVTGQIFYPTDGGYHQIYDGTQWRPIINGVVCTEPPTAATFSTQVNFSTSTLTKTNGSLYFNAPAPVASGTLRAAVTPIPTPSSCQIQGLFTVQNNFVIATVANNEFPGGGVVMYESGSGKFAMLGIGQGTSYAASQQDWIVASQSYWASSTSRTVGNDYIQHGTIPFMRLRIASGTIFWEISADLQTWQTLGSVAVTTVFTTAPTHYGVATSHFNSGGSVPPSLVQFNHLLLS